MDIQLKKLHLIEWLASLNDPVTIEALENWIRARSDKGQTDKTPEPIRQILFEAEAQYNAGKGVPDKEAREILKKRRNKN